MKNTIVAFHIGRGGRFNNAGHLTFRGVYTLAEVMNLREESHGTFYNDKDITSPHYTDHNGNYLISKADLDSGVGKLEWDTHYDTDYTIYARDLNDEEAHLVLKEAMEFEGKYCLNYPLNEMLEGISIKLIVKAAKLGKLIEVYDYYHKGEEWLNENILDNEVDYTKMLK